MMPTNRGETVADEPVIAPDQLEPGHPRAARIGGIITIGILLAMSASSEKGYLEDVVLIGIAALIALSIIIGTILRRSGITR